MSDYFVKNNQESTTKTFYKKFLYNYNMQNSQNNIVDFTYAEKLLYGRVGKYYETLVLKSEDSLVEIGKDSGNSSLRVLNFVASAFKDMNLTFKERNLKGMINSSDPYLSNLRPYKAFQSAESMYKDYNKSYSNIIIKKFKERNLTSLNFDVFLSELDNIIFSGESVRIMPFTKPAFVKSRWCPINCSGLAIEIADLKYSNDDDKINKFINSPNWEFYVNATNKFGFMIDMNAPWRLVADINSLYMQEKIGQVNPGAAGGTSPWARSFYSSIIFSYYSRFKTYLLNLYNEIVASVPTRTKAEFCKNGSLATTIIAPKTYTIEQLGEIYPEEFFMNFYFKIRLAEEESKLSELQKKKLADDAIRQYRAYSVGAAISAFERILNKTFDYNGSMDYYRRNKAAIDGGKQGSAAAPKSGRNTTGGGY